MTYEEKCTPEHHKGFVAVTGKLPALSSKNLSRVSVFLVKRNAVLSESPVNAGGTFQFHVAPHLANAQDAFVVLGPKGADEQTLASHADLPRVALANAYKQEHGGLNVEFAGQRISDEIIDLWWIWCREYTVSGTLETSAGCPIGAVVTVYNVTSGVDGLVQAPIATVPTDADGNFTFSFNWCSRLCWWPCWPIWWRCWPWWWELDILAVIDNLERRVVTQAPGVAAFARASVAPLRQPHGADLMTGVGFAGSRAESVLKPDSARTSLIASKFNDPRIREIFPWWWWCCENPNLVFSATQGANVILQEDPNTSTRWCFASGQSVTLVGNDLSLGACPGGSTGGDCAFAWTSVGSEAPNWVLAENISMGYADGSGACSNLAFAGSLNLNGVFAGDCASFYQVLAGKWGGNGNPARGGTAPLTSNAVSLPTQLVNYVSIWRQAILNVEVDPVVMGPFSYNGFDNLYTTVAARQANALPGAVTTQIGAFPTVAAPDFVIGWAAPDLVMTTPAGDLIAPATAGGVTLSINPFDASGNPIPLPPAPSTFDMGPPMTLMIDTTPLTTASVDSVTVYNSDGTLATKTAASSTACPAYLITTPDGGYVLIHTTVTDNNGHLCEYYVQTQYGDGSYAAASPSDRDYAQAPATFTVPSGSQLYGVDAGYSVPNDLPLPPPPPQVPAVGNWTFVGGGDTTQVQILESCCYDFQLWVSKRTTDGETFACGAGNPAFQTVNITVAPALS